MQYRQYVVNDPRIYLSKDLSKMKIGTAEQASKEEWVSMTEYRKKFNSEEEFIRAVSSITMFNTEELMTMSFLQKEMWDRFESKINNSFMLIFTLDIFKKYTRNTLLKFIKNGYDRIEFRALLTKLKEYDAEGNFVKEHDEKMYLDAFDEVYNEVIKDHPNFSVGFIFFGLKIFPAHKNEELFTKVCEFNWDKTIVLDFVQ